MDISYSDILELIKTCEEFDGTINDSAAAGNMAAVLGISKVAYRIFSEGVPGDSEVIFTAPSAKLGEEFNYSKETTDTKTVVVRIYRFPDETPLDETQRQLLNIFAETVLSGVAVRNLINAYDDLFYYDPMTRVANKTFFFKKLTELLMRNVQDKYAIIYSNIRNCKVMNKLFGYETTDKMMRDFAQDINEKLDRNNGELIARLGGDNFVFIVLKDHLPEIVEFIQKVPINIVSNGDFIEYIISVNAGVVLMTNLHDDPGIVMSAASATVALAKRSNSKNIIYYNENTDNILNDQKNFVEELRNDLKEGNFLVYYQPIYRNDSDLKIAGAEALVRWRRQGHIVTPDSFISVAEQNNLISDIDLYVLDTVCCKLKQWIHEGINVVPVSFNFSHYDLITSDITEDIIRIVDNYDIDHSLINIEFTEAGFHEEYEALCFAASKLKATGIAVTIDNYGKGYSSIKLLHELECDSVKISSGFTVSPDPKKNIILEGLITIANRLGLNVISTGLQDEERINELKGFGCNLFQTDIYDKALSERFFSNKLKNN